MSDTSVKMDLMLPTQVDAFSTLAVRQNFEKIDAAPGTHICTSTTRPTWSSAKAGRKIYETNTGLEWVWDGTVFRRLAGVGLLKTNTGAWAIGEHSSNASTGTTTYVIATSVANVVVPAGNRPLRVDVAWVQAVDSTSEFDMAIFRSATNNSGPIMSAWVSGNTGQPSAGGGVFWAIERDGLAAGVYNFSLQFHVIGSGTATLYGNATTPITIMVTEL